MDLFLLRKDNYLPCLLTNYTKTRLLRKPDKKIVAHNIPCKGKSCVYGNWLDCQMKTKRFLNYSFYSFFTIRYCILINFVWAVLPFIADVSGGIRTFKRNVHNNLSASISDTIFIHDVSIWSAHILNSQVISTIQESLRLLIYSVFSLC